MNLKKNFSAYFNQYLLLELLLTTKHLRKINNDVSIKIHNLYAERPVSINS